MGKHDERVHFHEHGIFDWLGIVLTACADRRESHELIERACGLIGSPDFEHRPGRGLSETLL